MILQYRPVTAADIKTICSFPLNAQELFYMFPKAQYPLTEAQLSNAITQRLLNGPPALVLFAYRSAHARKERHRAALNCHWQIASYARARPSPPAEINMQNFESWES
jgi:hypothetical protein